MARLVSASIGEGRQQQQQRAQFTHDGGGSNANFEPEGF